MATGTEAGPLPPAVRQFGWAWVALALSLGAHVADEALTDFLSVYNPAVEAIRQRLPWFPMPTLTFDGWLSGLIMFVSVLLALTPLAFRAPRWLIWLAYPLGLIMVLNGVGHVVGTVYMGRAMPGVYSSPLLLVAAPLLLIQARRVARAGGTA